MDGLFKIENGDLIFKEKSSIKITKNGLLVVKLGKQNLEVIPKSFKVDGKRISLADLRSSTDSIQLDG